MNYCSPQLLEELSAIVGAENLKSEEKVTRPASKDCYHFSPVLIPQLEDCHAEAIVYPATEEELIAIIKACVAAKVPITPRGGGTGNYGQGVPMQGGIMVNTRRMNQVFTLNSEIAHVAAGVNLWTIERDSAAVGGVLRMFPSTIRTSSAAGFITGGSGGVGSVNWGMLRDGDNIRHARVITAEPEPQVIDLESADALSDVLHNCGLTAFVSEVTFSLAPKTAWHQYIFAFDDFTKALECGQALALNNNILKRLATVFEWPIPSYFAPLVKREACPEGKSLIFFITDLNPEEMEKVMKPYSCVQTLHLGPEQSETSRGFQIYDFTWNHTTQWAMKANPNLTYLQEMFDPKLVFDQLSARKEKFGDQLLAHVEFIRDEENGVRPACLSIVDYKGSDQLWEVIEWSEANGIGIANPHTHYLDDDNRWYGDNFLAAKKRWDPYELFNPGHLHVLEKI